MVDHEQQSKSHAKVIEESPAKPAALTTIDPTCGEVIALHGFIKKTQKTAPADLVLATKRMKEVTKS